MSILGSRGWLAQTPAEFRDQFLSAARWRQVDQGTILTLGGEEKDDFIGLAHGTVAFTSTLGAAGTPVMHMAQAVFWLGYGALLLNRPRVVTAEARTNLWVAVIPSTKILPLLDETTLWWRCFMQLLVEYGDTTATIASDLLIRRSDQRLAATILRFAGLRSAVPWPEKEVRVPVTQAELAEASNLSRNVAGAILRKLAAKGFVQADYCGIVVRDPPGLRGFVAEV